MLVISVIVLGPADFKSSAMIPSSPDALLFLSRLICLLSSFSSGGNEYESVCFEFLFANLLVGAGQFRSCSKYLASTLQFS